MSTATSFVCNATPGWTPFVATLPRGFASARVGLQGLDTQSNPLTWWDDGSVRQALVIARATATAGYPLLADPPALALDPMPTPIWPAAVVTFTDGTAYTASLPSFQATAEPWFDGPLAMERRIVVVPRTGTGMAHTLVQVTFDVRSHRDGTHRVVVGLMNARDVIEDTSVNLGQLTIMVGGSVVRAAADQRLWQGQYPFWIGASGGYLESRVDPDPELLFQSGLFQRIIPDVESPLYAPVGPEWAAGGHGDMGDRFPMQQGGGSATLGGAGTKATCEWLAHPTPQIRAQVFAQGRVAGSYSVHLRQADGVGMIRLTDSPHFEPKTFGGYAPLSRIEGAHLLRLCTLPYVLSGDRVWLDQIQSWAATALWAIYDGVANSNSYSTVNYDYSRHARGRICYLGCNYFGEPRGIGRVLMAVVDAAVCTPDRWATDKKYFSDVAQENVDEFDLYARTHQLGPFNPPGADTDPGTGPGGYGSVHLNATSVSPWQWTEAAIGLLHAQQNGFVGDRAMLRRIFGWYLSMFVAANEADWNYICRMHYPRMGRHVTGGGYDMYQTWGAIKSANWGSPPPEGWDSNDNGGQAGAPYYLLEYRFLLLGAKAEQLPGWEKPLAFVHNQAIGQAAGRAHYAFGDWSGIADPPGQTVPPPVVVDPPPVTVPPPAGSRVLTSVLTATLNEADQTVPFTLTIPIAAAPVPPPLPPPPAELPHIRQSYLETPIPRAVGEQFPLTAIAWNVGRGAATGVVLDTGLDPALDVVEQSAGAAFDPASGEWHIGTLASGERKDLAMKVKVKA